MLGQLNFQTCSHPNHPTGGGWGANHRTGSPNHRTGDPNHRRGGQTTAEEAQTTAQGTQTTAQGAQTTAQGGAQTTAQGAHETVRKFSRPGVDVPKRSICSMCLLTHFFVFSVF